MTKKIKSQCLKV